MGKRNRQERPREPEPEPVGGLVIFDLDGVLVDSRTAITTCIDHALRESGLPGHDDLSELERFVGPPLAVGFAELAGVAVDDPIVETCIARYRERYANDMVPLSQPFPGIPEALAELGSRYPLLVATSKPRAFAIRLLDGHGLLDAFAHVEGPDLDSRAEGKTETIERALDTDETRPAVMIGDREYDILGALGNDLPSIGVLWGIGDRAELTNAGATELVASPEDLVDVVDGLLLRT